jgi:D-3-phosphoglycerate dehydrogenase / 2-oxoglutarate reductase
MAKVLVADALSERAAEIFIERGLEVDVRVGLKPEELLSVIGQYDGLAVRSATKVTAQVLEAAPNLKVIGRAGIGVDNIDVPAATARGVVVMNTPYGNTITTAEHAIAMMFALARQIPAADRSTQAGKWEKSKFMGVELFGKTLGLIGCGNIGSIVAERALGLKMKVIAFDPFLSPERATDLGVEKVELDDLLKRSDFITLHTPMTEQTKGIINAAALKKCRKGVRIINCARGGLVVEEDLRAALDSGHVAGAAFDVFVEEPARENVLFGLDTVVTTPHLGAATEEAQENVALQIAEQISDYLLTGAVSNALNMPSISAEEAPRLKPFMGLAEQLGSFAGQLTESGLKKLMVEYRGNVAGLNTRPLTALILMGLLKPLLTSVNMVNAPVIARERNIDVTEMKNDQSVDFQSLIRVTVETERQTRTVAGALFGTLPRVVQVQDITFDAQLGPHMLFIRNEDKPGFIGKLGTILGNGNVNIANFHLGRSPGNGHALALVEIDEPCSDAVAAQIAAVEGVIQAKMMRF